MEERLMSSEVVGTKMIALMTLAVALISESSCSTNVELPDHRCGQLGNGGWGLCDIGRCCGTDYYCVDGPAFCRRGKCAYYCSLSTGDGAGLVNATHNHYLDGVDDYNLIAATDGSNSSSASAALSCASSLSRLSPGSRRRYPWAGFRAAAVPNYVTYCGRCMQVIVSGGGGIYSQVKVRVVHEGNMEGLELDRNTFNQLDVIGGGNSVRDRLIVKYQFESC